MKLNSRRIFIVITLILLALLVGYYFLIFAPVRNSKNNQTQLQNKIKCNDAGEKYVSKNTDENTPYGAIYDKPEYSFSKELNTCLYRKEFSIFLADGTLSSSDFSIIDIYSNRVIASVFQHYDLAGNYNAVRGDKEKYSLFVDKYFQQGL